MSFFLGKSISVYEVIENHEHEQLNNEHALKTFDSIGRIFFGIWRGLLGRTPDRLRYTHDGERRK